MSGENKACYLPADMEQRVRQRLTDIRTMAPDSIGALMNFRLLECDPAAGEYTMDCDTFSWMRNIPGTLHGGMCAAILDQAMGFIAYCVKSGEGIAPTVQLQVNYHRPIVPGESIRVRVKVLSVSRSLMHLSAQAFRPGESEKLCLSGTALSFFKSAE